MDYNQNQVIDNNHLYSKINIYQFSPLNAKKITNGSYLSSGLWSFPNIDLSDDGIYNAYISLQHAEIPNSTYIVNYSNNILKLQTTTFGIITITCPEGNFNVLNFISTINALLSSYNFSFSYNNITNKLTLTNNVESFIVLTSSTIKNIIGIGDVDLSSGVGSLTFPNVVNFLPTSRIQIRSSFFSSIGNYGIFNNSDLLFSLQNTGSQTARCLFQNYNGQKFLLDNFKGLSVFDMRLTDDSGNDLDFHGVPFYLSFQIEIVYKSKKEKLSFNDIIRNNQM